MTASVLHLPGAAATAIIKPNRRGRWPKGVVSIQRGRLIRQRREAAAESEAEPRGRFAQVRDLPFVADVKVPGFKRRTRRSFWSVPPAKSYAAACEDGVYFACAYLIYLSYQKTPGLLGWILRDMQANVPPAGDDAQGYQVGFCAELERRLILGWGNV